MRRSQLLISILTVGGLTLATACGGGGTPAPATPTGGDPGSAATPTGGTAAAGATGVLGLDWGASEDAVKAAFPQATARPEGGLWSMGTSERIAALTMFKFGAKGLEQVSVEWTEGYPTMDACAAGWKKVRAVYDGRYGASQADNLAGYWKSPTASVTLTCTPNESGAGVLAATITPPQK